MKIFVYPWLLLAPVLFISGEVYAYCAGGNGILSTVEVSIPQHMSEGEIFRSLDSQTRADMAITCTNMPTGTTDMIVGIKAYGVDSGLTSLRRKIFKLGDSGLGYVVAGLDDWDREQFVTTAEDYLLGTNAKVLYGAKIAPDGRKNLSVGLRLTFYKIGPIKPGRYSQPVAAAVVALPESEKPYVNQEFPFTTGMITINAPSCSVNNSTIPVTLGRITTAQLPKVGSTAAETGFNIPLTCEPKAKVYMTLQATERGAYNATQGIINLRSGSKDRAKDVGVQILDGRTNAPIHLDKKIHYATTGMGGTVNIPLKARYYRYGNNMKTGIANATATFTMSYE
ncbi:type 1 fimbrial protein [Xenorhabdus sp. Reich]|uniref:Type 1 fimbrial protein n=1 Tax=Xenorhabdus littoralis TaxID=2582835 RepID=A0ABU4SNM5_9GAMM|nr:fimbrial protein [Xenorhabdus sp. Reich]MDX8000253.1 type 1 fimbrial protein [Xenorhabdus sp. Reich]